MEHKNKFYQLVRCLINWLEMQDSLRWAHMLKKMFRYQIKVGHTLQHISGE